MVRMVMHTKTKHALFSDLSVSGHLKYICFQFSLDKMDPRDGLVLRGMRSSKHASKMDTGYTQDFPVPQMFHMGNARQKCNAYIYSFKYSISK